MPRKTASYLHLRPGDALPAIALSSPFIAIVLVEDEVSQMWQWELSRWLVSSGCRYMLAWGRDCDSWDDSVDEANLEAYDYEEIPDDSSVITTSHEDEDLEEVFWFARHSARHPVHPLDATLIVHIAQEGKRDEMEALFLQA